MRHSNIWPVVTLAILVALWAIAAQHTTQGANFGCWPEPFPPLPRFLQYWYEVYCHA